MGHSGCDGSQASGPSAIGSRYRFSRYVLFPVASLSSPCRHPVAALSPSCRPPVAPPLSPSCRLPVASCRFLAAFLPRPVFFLSPPCRLPVATLSPSCRSLPQFAVACLAWPEFN